MKIVFATYIDNQSVIKYPIEFLLKENPELFVYCSDRENQLYLFEGGIIANKINFKVKCPGDIARAQNICIDKVFKEHNADFVVWQQADMYLTEEAYYEIEEICIEKNKALSFSFDVRHLRLFHVGVDSNWGVTIIGKDCKNRFDGDGASIPGNVLIDSNDAIIDIGYLSISQYKNHLKQHEITWNSPNKWSQLNEKEFIKTILEYNKNFVGLYNLIEKDSIHYHLVKELGFEDEYEIVKQYVNETSSSNS